MRHTTTETIYRGKLIDLERRRYADERGERAYEVVVHPGAVVILATPAPDALVLVEQRREAAGRRLWEAPAGVIDPGEDAATAAARELREETGYRAATVTPLWRVYSAPGFCTESLAFFHAEGLVPGEREPDEDEATMIVRTYALPELRAMLAAGDIRDLKTLAAIHWLADRVR